MNTTPKCPACGKESLEILDDYPSDYKIDDVRGVDDNMVSFYSCTTLECNWTSRP